MIKKKSANDIIEGRFIRNTIQRNIGDGII